MCYILLVQVYIILGFDYADKSVFYSSNVGVKTVSKLNVRISVTMIINPNPYNVSLHLTLKAVTKLSPLA